MTTFSWLLLVALIVSVVRGLNKSVRLHKLKEREASLSKRIELRCPHCDSRKSVRHTVRRDGSTVSIRYDCDMCKTYGYHTSFGCDRTEKDHQEDAEDVFPGDTQPPVVNPGESLTLEIGPETVVPTVRAGGKR